MENLPEVVIWGGGGLAVFLVIALTITSAAKRSS